MQSGILSQETPLNAGFLIVMLIVCAHPVAFDSRKMSL